MGTFQKNQGIEPLLIWFAMQRLLSRFLIKQREIGYQRVNFRCRLIKLEASAWSE